MDFKEELKNYQNYMDEKLDEYFKDDNTYENPASDTCTRNTRSHS